jgi:hypothetical protein
VNGDSGTLVPGTPVYVDSSGDMHAANASAAATASVFGLLLQSTATAVSGAVQFDCGVTLTTSQWNAVTGGSGGLTAGSWYFLSTTTGQITATAPSTTGQLVVTLGLAIGTTTLVLNVQPYIQL